MKDYKVKIKYTHLLRGKTRVIPIKAEGAFAARCEAYRIACEDEGVNVLQGFDVIRFHADLKFKNQRK